MLSEQNLKSKQVSEDISSAPARRLPVLDLLQYADRKGNFTFGLPYSTTLKDDWLIHDFTLEELKELRRTQRYGYRNQNFNNLFQMMTLEETIELMFDM